MTWKWAEYAPGIPPIPHNVVSMTGAFDSGPPVPPGSPPTTEFSHTFTAGDVGTHRYYCHPHGAPHLVESALGGELLNEFGMRGAVVVEDD